MTSGFLFGLFALLLQLYSVSPQSLPATCQQCTAYTCRRISGIYTVTVLTRGTYNPVVEIPAKACSINITEFARSDNYIAVRTKDGEGIINSKWALAQPGHYYGAGVRFSYDRNSGSCKGSCIYSLGPTEEDVVVQLLYYDKNPGIAYEFVIPNTVSFSPFDGVAPPGLSSSSSSTAADQSSPDTGAAQAPQKITFARKESGSASSRRRVRLHRQRGAGRRHGRRQGEEGGDSLRESYPDAKDPRTEGRPDVTSAAEGGPPPQDLTAGTSYGSHTLGGRGLSYTYGGPSGSARSRNSGSERRPDVTSAADSGSPSKDSGAGKSYGSHTLGGRGLSYTHGNPSGSSRSPSRSRSTSRTSRRRDKSTQQGRHVIERYRPSSASRSGGRPASTPRYISGVRRQDPRRRGSTSSSSTGYVRRPRYQSFSGQATSFRDNKLPVYGRDNQVDRFSRRTSLRTAPSRDTSQYRWKISGFSECSQTCGGGFQKTTIVCVSLSSRTHVVVTPENCANHLKPRQQTVACNKSPCAPAWEAEPWSDCTVSCGSGTQTRTVECRQRFSPTLTLKVSADECGLSRKPAVAQQCDMGLCARWAVGPWSECEECGDGERRREVRCLDQFDSPIPGNFCSQVRPPSTEPCDTRPCEMDWWLSDWTPECSVTCGEGIKTRKALCMDNQGAITESRRCSKKELPALEEVCRSDAGCRGTWFTGAWGKCSTDCGEGVRHRQVLCVHRPTRQGQLEVTSVAECEAAMRPDTEQACSQANCEASWYAAPWGQCSVTCGDGYMSRNVRCITDGRRSDNDGKDSSSEEDNADDNVSGSRPVESSRCVASLRPDTRKVCSRGPCPQESPRYQRTNRYEPASPTRYDTAASRYDTSRLDTSRFDAGRYAPANKKCRDRYRRKCLMALQARICSYPYYQRHCCQSCRKYVTQP